MAGIKTLERSGGWCSDFSLERWPFTPTAMQAQDRAGLGTKGDKNQMQARTGEDVKCARGLVVL